jgi:hypothetical protein
MAPGSKSNDVLNASVKSASGNALAASAPAGLGALCADGTVASAAAGAAAFGAGTVTPAILRGCGSVNPFFVFNWDVGEFEPLDGLVADVAVDAAVADDGPPKTPKDEFVDPHPGPPAPAGRTGHTPVALGAGTRGAGIDDLFAFVSAGGGAEGAGGAAGGAAAAGFEGELLLPRLGHALATGTPTPKAFGGGGPTGGVGISGLGGGTRKPPVKGAGMELKLDVLSIEAPPPPLVEAALVASWKLWCFVP